MIPARPGLLAAVALSILQASPAPLAAPAVLQDERAAERTPAERLQAIRDELAAAHKAFSAAYRAASTDEERQALVDSMYPDGMAFAARYRDLAREWEGAPAAAEAWIESLRVSRGGRAERETLQALLGEAVTVLLGSHLDSEQLVHLPELLGWPMKPEESEPHLRLLREKAGVERARAGASFKLATLLIEDLPRATDERRAEARRLLEEVRERHGELLDTYGRRFGPMVEGWLFQLDHLQPGMPVPEIGGEDLQGVPFKLSDYRGKVILLDFWGDW